MVGTLVDARLAAGEHSATLDLASFAHGALPNGSYFYRIECGERSETRKLLVMR
jgi:hypothetical protein